MDAKLKADWIAALRSGEYRQYRGGIGDKDRKFLCCLGVGATVAEPDAPLFTTDTAARILDRFGLDGMRTPGESFTGAMLRLIEMNDVKSASFAEIADYIEANIPADEHSVAE